MNKNQALKRAREIWGDGALIQDAKKANVLPNGAVLSERYKVGRYLAGFFSVQGDGKTWEEAFAKHEERERHWYREKAAMRKSAKLKK